jgi:hypothetical protein
LLISSVGSGGACRGLPGQIQEMIKLPVALIRLNDGL